MFFPAGVTCKQCTQSDCPVDNRLKILKACDMGQLHPLGKKRDWTCNLTGCLVEHYLPTVASYKVYVGWLVPMLFRKLFFFIFCCVSFEAGHVAVWRDMWTA